MVNNKVILIGRLCADARIIEPKREGQDKIAHILLAVDKPKRKKEGDEKEQDKEKGSDANFIWLSAFGGCAVFLEKFGKKGVKFAIEGHLDSHEYEKDGQRMNSLNVIVENIQFCEKKSQDSEEGFIEIPEEMIQEMPFK